MTEDQQYIKLYGGKTRPGRRRPQHHVYMAAVADIIANREGGWSKVHSTWDLSDCDIDTYDAIQLPA